MKKHIILLTLIALANNCFAMQSSSSSQAYTIVAQPATFAETMQLISKLKHERTAKNANELALPSDVMEDILLQHSAQLLRTEIKYPNNNHDKTINKVLKFMQQYPTIIPQLVDAIILFQPQWLHPLDKKITEFQQHTLNQPLVDYLQKYATDIKQAIDEQYKKGRDFVFNKNIYKPLMGKMVFIGQPEEEVLNLLQENDQLPDNKRCPLDTDLNLLTVIFLEKQKQRNVFKFLLEHGFNISNNKMLEYYLLNIGCEDQEIFEMLLKRGLNVNLCINNKSLIHIHSYASLAKTNLAILKKLMQHGANVNIKNSLGETVLHVLIEQAYFDKYTEQETIEIIKLLLQHGADINARNSDGQTALEFLQQNRENYLPQIEKYLQAYMQPPYWQRTKNVLKKSAIVLTEASVAVAIAAGIWAAINFR